MNDPDNVMLRIFVLFHQPHEKRGPAQALDLGIGRKSVGDGHEIHRFPLFVRSRMAV